MQKITVIIAAVMLTSVAGQSSQAADSSAVRAVFLNPPRQYSSAPLWVWNDMLTEEQVVSTLRDLAGQGVRQAFVHPRPGLMTPYLSDEWFRLWAAALQEAKKLDMNLWIYDENSYPSGFAGGLVPDAMPQSRGKGLVFRSQIRTGKIGDDVLAVFKMTGDGFENITARVRAGVQLPEAKYLVVKIAQAQSRPWHGGKFYVDLTKPGVTEKFLEITLDAYKSHFGDEFGRHIPGSFTDEPHLAPAGELHWTDDLEDVFKKRWGYSLIDNLPGLVRPVGDYKRVRHNYYQVLLELFIERWAKPYYEYCAGNNLEFTGHYWEHEWPNCTRVPDNMAMNAWQQRPGIDNLMNSYSEDVRGQFGNVRAVKELASVANQLGRPRTLCEAYGAGGWDMRFEDMKRIGDWLAVLGINTLDQHLSYITIRGARKRDHPQSFSYHEPWWRDYHIVANYFARLSAVLSQGEQINNILVIEPTTTAWMYQFDPRHKQILEAIGAKFQRLVTDLAKTQVEFDIGCEDIIAHHGSVDGVALKVGRRSYSTVVLAEMTENLDSTTMDLLEAYARAGGKILCCGDAPALVDAEPSQRGQALSQSAGFEKVTAERLPAALQANHRGAFSIRANAGSEGILFHQRRELDDGDILFITNTDISEPVSGVIESQAGSIEKWVLDTGKVVPYEFKRANSGVRANFRLAPCGSVLLFLSKGGGESAQPETAATAKIAATAGPVIRRIAPDVLTIDYVDITAGGETRKNLYFYRANQFAFQKNGLKRNPWDSAVQFKDEIITKKFGADSGFEATYRFTIERSVPKSLYIIIERPDLYSISCNGESVTAEAGRWWLDKSFGRIDIGSSAKAGDNEVTIKASPFTIYDELESAYVLGDFSLKAVDSGFVIVPDEPLKLGKWNEQGHPFYAEGVSYTQSFNVVTPKGRYYVQLPSWYGSVARVIVNGSKPGHIYHQPWECDVTGLIKSGTNTIEVVVVGTLKNTLGPHHANPTLGMAWPASFQKAPTNGPPAGKKYNTVGYGLFQPFELVQRR